MAKMDVKRLQLDMAVRGLYTHDIDGKWGSESERAYRAMMDSIGKVDLAPGQLAWGARVSTTFKMRVREICQTLGIADPNWLMACMAFESAETFAPDIINAAGSGAIGLIQFMPATARHLGTSTEALATISAEEQLTYVERYFFPYRGRMKNLGDVYMAILWPAGIGKQDNWVLWDKATRPTTYRQNIGLDVDRNGQIIRAEAISKIQAKLNKGLLPQNLG